MDKFILTDDNGKPEGVVDPDAINRAGEDLAIALVGEAGNEDRTLQISQQFLARYGSDAFGFIAARALMVVTDVYAAGAFDIVRASAGIDIRAKVKGGFID